MIQRANLQALVTRMKDARRFIQVIMGPRQVGKTTTVMQFLESHPGAAHFVSSESGLENTIWLQQQWEAARKKMDADGTEEFILVIDEIQKIANWSEKVKELWDEDSRKKRNLKVILLGSSRLMLQTGLTESLAGRFETMYMGHWSFEEMNAAFGWDAKQFAWFGGYPGAAPLIEDETRWKNYVRDSLIETSISKDILMLSRVDKPALLKQLFEAGSHYSGQILSYNKMLGQLHDAGNTTTLAHYLELLDTAGLVGGIWQYAPDVIRKRSSSPKFQVHNTALISALRKESFAEALNDPGSWGRVVESAVGAHLLNHAISKGLKLHYWREANDEVDFVLEHKKVIAIEVKTGLKKQGKGMSVFQKKFNPDKVYLISADSLTWEDFLKIDPMELF